MQEQIIVNTMEIERLSMASEEELRAVRRQLQEAQEQLAQEQVSTSSALLS